jgi:hypothetical protein
MNAEQYNTESRTQLQTAAAISITIFTVAMLAAVATRISTTNKAWSNGNPQGRPSMLYVGNQCSLRHTVMFRM